MEQVTKLYFTTQAQRIIAQNKQENRRRKKYNQKEWQVNEDDMTTLVQGKSGGAEYL